MQNWFRTWRHSLCGHAWPSTTTIVGKLRLFDLLSWQSRAFMLATDDAEIDAMTSLPTNNTA
jgi:hypothetical protein